MRESEVSVAGSVEAGLSHTLLALKYSPSYTPLPVLKTLFLTPFEPPSMKQAPQLTPKTQP